MEKHFGVLTHTLCRYPGCPLRVRRRACERFDNRRRPRHFLLPLAFRSLPLPKMSGVPRRLGMFTGSMSILLVLACAPGDAEGCTCVGPINTCAALTSAAAAFEATVESTAHVTMPSERDASAPVDATESMTQVTLREVRPLRGNAPATILTAAFSASCGYEFTPGGRYLIVAYRRVDGHLEVSKCGLTRPIAGARGIIEYLQSSSSHPQPPIRVWGRVMRASKWIDFEREYTGVPRARVTFDGVTRLSVETAADGSYRTDALPPGRYSVTVAIPPAMTELGSVRPETIELGADPGTACLELEFVAPIDSAIAGVVLDGRGQPASNVFVTFRFPDQRDYSRGGAGGGYTTGADGRFEFKGLPPGRYAVGIESRARGEQPAPGETIVVLRLGERLTLAPLIVR